jgi:O-methyltransferase
VRALIDPAKRLLASLGVSVRRQFETTIGEVPHSTVNPRASYSPWLGDTAFLCTWEAVRGNTLVDVYRCFELWNLAEQVKPVPGDYLEVGVWRGGTGCLVADRFRQLGESPEIFLCDTFEGVVKAGDKDTAYVGGEHADTSQQVVEALVASLELQGVTILKGIFPDATGATVADRRFRMVHIDVDVYTGAKEITEFVWPRLAPGGMIVFDDYGFLECPGVTRYVNESLGAADRIVIQNLNGHAIMIKR